MLDGGKIGNTNVTYKDFLKEKFETVQALRSEKGKYIAIVKKLNDKISDLENRRQTLRKSLHRDH